MKNMIKADPFIAVTDIEASSKWYQKLFSSKCYGRDIKILADESGSVLLGLHKWREDQHPTMIDESITPGNGLMLYFRVSNLEKIRENAEQLGVRIDEDIHINESSGQEEFSLWDPDGYYVTISRYHDYGHGIT